MIATVRIMIKKDEDDLLDNGKITLVNFLFDPVLFVGYWVDRDDNTICFYISNLSFKTPYSEKTIEMFNDFLNGRGVNLN